MPHKFNAARRHKFDKAQYRVILGGHPKAANEGHLKTGQRN